MNRRVAGGLTAAFVLTVAVISMPTGVDAVAGQNATGGALVRSVPAAKQAGVQAGKVTPKIARDNARDGAASFVSAKPAALKLAAGDKPVAQPVVSSHGVQYVPYERTHDGLRVVGGDFVVATDQQGNILTTSVAQGQKVSLASTTPAITKAQARSVSEALVQSPKPEPTSLVILQKGGSHLAYETYVDGTRSGKPSRLAVYVDAQTGKVLSTREHVMYGSGSGTYNGPKPVTFGTTQSGSTYTMKDPNATNLSCQDEGNTPFSQSSDTGWGGGSATDKETACVDALFDADTEIKMLADWDGRDAQDGSGGAWPIHIGDNEENAYYDGTQLQIGYDDNGAWLTPIDVVAHELGHGVDDHTPGSISGGGTQEFVADTFGAATEWYADESSPYDTPDFTVGEEVDLGGGPIRYMYDPSVIGDPGCYSSSIPNAEVHSAAGPGNHWFYLLAEGSDPSDGQPQSPTCNNSSVSGIGIKSAEQIMYNAMLLKTSSSSYLKYRTWTLTAAKNLFPNDCTEFNAVKAAWDAVSVPAQSADPTCSAGGGSGTVSVTSPGNKTGTVGTAITAFTVSASGGTAPYTYTATGLPAGLSISSAGKVSGTPTTAGTSTTKVTATDADGATGSVSFTYTISGSGGGGGSCTGQVLANPGFESGNSGWTASSGVIDDSSDAPAHSGSYKAWLDGYGTTHTDTLSQSVTIPSGCTATLTFYLYVSSEETSTSTAYDTLSVKVGSTTVKTYSNLDNGSGYVKRTLDLSSAAGSTVTLTFTGKEDSELATSFLLDDTALTLS